MKIEHFVNLFFICKPIKLQPLWDVCWQHNPNHMNHGLAYLTSLMARVQSFKVLSTKCDWSSLDPSPFIIIGIQLAQLKLNSLAFYYQAWPLFGRTIVGASITFVQ